MSSPFGSTYARSIGVTEADAHTARNIHLSVADCRHIKKELARLAAAETMHPEIFETNQERARWSRELREYLKTAV